MDRLGSSNEVSWPVTSHFGSCSFFGVVVNVTRFGDWKMMMIMWVVGGILGLGNWIRSLIVTVKVNVLFLVFVFLGTIVIEWQRVGGFEADEDREPDGQNDHFHY